MKKQFFTFISCTLISLSAYCQSHEQARIIDVLDDVALSKQFRYDVSKTQGSPYLNDSFLPAIVTSVSKHAIMRYDVYNDEFEFVNAKMDTLVLNKLATYNDIVLSGTNVKYKLVDYTNNKGKATTGYLIWIYDKNNFTLFKKQNIIYNKERIAKTGYEKDTPANFERVKDSYYFKNDDKGIMEFPTGKKELIRLYPDRKTAIENFIKQNNIDFDKESDIIKLVDFLADR